MDNNFKLVLTRNNFAIQYNDTEVHAFWKEPIGEKLITETSKFTVPEYVGVVSVVCVGRGGNGNELMGGGGGGLAFCNNIQVTSGDSIQIDITTSYSKFGNYINASSAVNEVPGDFNNLNCIDLDFGGGKGGIGSKYGGGGAAGYYGDGGQSYMKGTFGSASGGVNGGGGGGVGLNGIGVDGFFRNTMYSELLVGSGGSGGEGSKITSGTNGGLYGGGGGFSGDGAKGACRIIWGEGRTYPHNAF